MQNAEWQKGEFSRRRKRQRHPGKQLTDDRAIAHLTSCRRNGSEPYRGLAIANQAVMEQAGRPAAKTFQDVIAWRKGHLLAARVHLAALRFPPSERYRLVDQLGRAADSVPSNIAEAFKRRSRKDKSRFLNIAQASLEEARNHLLVARERGYLPDRLLLELADEVARILFCYARAIDRSRPS